MEHHGSSFCFINHIYNHYNKTAAEKSTAVEVNQNYAYLNDIEKNLRLLE